MSKTSLLRSLQAPANGIGENRGGTFFLFSQFSEDLTRNFSDGDAYKAVPSKFAAFNIDYTGKTSQDVGELFQNTFESSCAKLRTEHADYEHNDITSMFWQTMAMLVDPRQEEASVKYNDALVHIGTADVTGSTVINGDSYSDIYCYIDSSERRKIYQIGSLEAQSESTEDDSPTTYCYGWSSATYPRVVGTDDSEATVWLNGLRPDGNRRDLVPATVDLPAPLSPVTQITEGDNMASHSQTIDDTTENVQYDVCEDSSFMINTIAVFYDIAAKDEQGEYEVIAKNVPLGIYFTGPVEDGVMANAVIKQVTHGDIYGQGTAYGLRISTKFSSAPIALTGEQQVTQASVVSVEGTSAASAAAVLASMRETCQTIERSIASNADLVYTVKSHLAGFRDKSTNIPYIKKIGGTDYWFVNGRSTGRKVSPTTSDIDIDDITGQVQAAVTEQLSDIASGISEALTPDDDKYIIYIDKDTYKGNTTVVSIPNTEDFQDLTTADSMFSGCKSLERIPRLELANCTSMKNAFKDCESIKSIYCPDTIMCTSFAGAFSGCSELETVVIDGSSCKDFSGAFDVCTKLENITINNLRGSSSGYTIDLSQTRVSVNSVIKIIRGIQYEMIRDEDPLKLTLKVPSGISEAVPAIYDALYDAENNKGVHVELSH